MTKPLDVKPGQVFHLWKLLEEVDKKNGLRHWRARCECGTIRVVPLQHIYHGRSQSCGCIKKTPAVRKRVRERVKAENVGKQIVRQQFGKECSQCFQRKPLDLFWLATGPNHKSADGHIGHCIECGTRLNREKHIRRFGPNNGPQLPPPPVKLLVEPGTKFNRLTVVKEAEPRNGRRAFECSCDCGTPSFTVILQNLRNGNTKSCGCMLREQGHTLAAKYNASRKGSKRKPKTEPVPWAR